jgi:DtxR family Mn-dependent transcriptional regulator
MCRKLQDTGLVQYQPYKGVSLTDEGDRVARDILRKHRLWEVFLVEKLGLTYEQAHDFACELEHATADLLADHLDRFLEFPAVNPIGKPIPSTGQKIPERVLLSLDRLNAGHTGIVVHIDLPEDTQSYLEDLGLRTGAAFQVLAASSSSCLLKTGGESLSLNADLIRQIFVTLDPGSESGEISSQNDNQQIPSTHKEKHMQAENQITIKKIPMSELGKGQTGVVVHVGGKGAARRRMLDMGLVTGTEVSVIRIAPLGDPIEYSVKGYSLSLRKTEAETILVEISEDQQEN